MLRNEFEIINARLIEIMEHVLEIKKSLRFRNDDGSKKRYS